MSQFPSPDVSEDPDGLLAYSDNLSCSLLVDAYFHGIFPWPQDEATILWFSPPQRGILMFSELHIPSRLKRFLAHSGFSFHIDQHFPEVLDACATVKRQEEGTWITSKIRAAYLDFYRRGYAHSFETCNAEGKLVGGLYGVGMDHFFGGESMFFYESGASKYALLCMIATLKNCGLNWLDTQMVTSVTGSFGAKEIPRTEYLNLHRLAVRNTKPVPTEKLRANIGNLGTLLRSF